MLFVTSMLAMWETVFLPLCLVLQIGMFIGTRLQEMCFPHIVELVFISQLVNKCIIIIGISVPLILSS